MPYEEVVLKVVLNPWNFLYHLLQKLKVVPQDVKTYGTFYSGDSYICLSVSFAGTSVQFFILLFLQFILYLVLIFCLYIFMLYLYLFKLNFILDQKS